MNKKYIPDDDLARTDRALNAIKSKYRIVSTGKKSIKDFISYSSNSDSKVLKTWKISKTNNSFILYLISYTHYFQHIDYTKGNTGQMASETSKYFFGYLEINKDYGNTLIRPETLKDKVLELLNPIEIDIKEYKKFSRKYYMTSDNKDLLLRTIDENLVKYFETINNLTIEFSHDKCLFRLPKSVNVKEALMLCEIGLNLDSILNNEMTK